MMTNGKLDGGSVRWAPKGSHPSQVSGMFQNDPTFAEFRNILHQQREEDYRQANKEIDAMIRLDAESCSFPWSVRRKNHADTDLC